MENYTEQVVSGNSGGGTLVCIVEGTTKNKMLRMSVRMFSNNLRIATAIFIRFSVIDSASIGYFDFYQNTM